MPVPCLCLEVTQQICPFLSASTREKIVGFVGMLHAPVHCFVSERPAAGVASLARALARLPKTIEASQPEGPASDIGDAQVTGQRVILSMGEPGGERRGVSRV